VSPSDTLPPAPLLTALVISLSCENTTPGPSAKNGLIELNSGSNCSESIAGVAM